MTLSNEDIVAVIKILVELRNGRGEIDDIDHLGNRRVRSVGELAENQFRSGLVRVERAVRERLSQAESENLMPHDLINAKPVSAAIKEFFGSSQLSQFMDQTNPLSEITHKRRISALGPGGLTRERAGFEVRDVHPTHYGRVCPIETPEGPNIGLINSLALYARTNEFGFIETPYRRVKDGKVTKDIEYLSAIEEGKYVIAQANAELDKNGKFVDELVSCRHRNEFTLSTPDKIEYIDVAPSQIVSVAASLIPFLEHDDANRALMGSNMQRQAVPCLRAEKPLVGTGIERTVAIDSGTAVQARRGGRIDYVDAGRIVVRVNDDETRAGEVGVDIYNLTKYTRSNQNTNINQRPLVKVGDADRRAATWSPTAPPPTWASWRSARTCWSRSCPGTATTSRTRSSSPSASSPRTATPRSTSRSWSVVARDTKLGPEEITRDISNLSERMLSRLDESGIVYIGAEVEAADVLVGKVTPKGETQLTPEEKLLRAIFGEKASDVKDTQPARALGHLRHGDRRPGVHARGHRARQARPADHRRRSSRTTARTCTTSCASSRTTPSTASRRLLINKTAKGGKKLAKGAKVTKAYLAGDRPPRVVRHPPAGRGRGRAARAAARVARPHAQGVRPRLRGEEEEAHAGRRAAPGRAEDGEGLRRGEAPPAAGRQDGRPPRQQGRDLQDRPGRGHAVHGRRHPRRHRAEPAGRALAHERGPDPRDPPRAGPPRGWAADPGDAARQRERRRRCASSSRRSTTRRARRRTSRRSRTTRSWSSRATSRAGVPFATPVFDGATEIEIKDMLEIAGLPRSGQIALFDGRTGDAFDRPVTVGYMHILKLHHLVDDKMHARSTGPYSLVTQQPLGGKAQFGGQRFGEMEVWALEAYGAAYTLQEMLTVKSDDTQGRTKVYENIVKGEHKIEAGMPESFNVLVKEIRSLAIDIDLERY